ncbi:hypothetical protein CC1G_15766 [Coprinopsis cinerea okayama7|uniref:Uncharacterized protein n=1 Tax=Coprinopsis cinerea (strain Okayama-7 / 130 / ATCC MYA-4618 / FGSC 9003) TaxID=240176 RepID=D6RQY0_COPC7|nr:hypothetical protein CC1G_15766 [Coprinopsis cinerea okayama7\|eukprot:XP_002910047.1 hypothetical protein CC1G_15766 [Coprinopsis cinerea okayama7\
MTARKHVFGVVEENEREREVIFLPFTGYPSLSVVKEEYASHGHESSHGWQAEKKKARLVWWNSTDSEERLAMYNCHELDLSFLSRRDL